MAIDPISSGAIFSVLRQIQLQSTQIAISARRLSSGLRINSAADDPAGIFRVQRFQAQINGLNAAATNTQNGISAAQSAEGGLTEIQSLLADIQTQAISVQNPLLTSGEIDAIQTIVQQDFTAITNIIGETQFNGIGLINGSTAFITLQTGPNAGQTTTLTLPNATTILSNDSISSSAASDLQRFLSATDAQLTGGSRSGPLVTSASTAFDDIGVQVSTFGGAENALQANLNVLNSMSVATSSALSNLRDANIASETVALQTAVLRQQAGIAILSQITVQAQSLLKLLQAG